jgi:predicted component of type VI protein secretion system
MRTLELEVHDTETGERRVHGYSRSPVTIGRNPRNDLPLGFGFVSGWHAKIEFDERGGVFTDLGSTNGTSLDGRRVEAQRPLAIGDGLRVLIGKLELNLRWREARETSVSGVRLEPTPAPGGIAATAHSTRSTRSSTIPVPVFAEGGVPGATGLGGSVPSGGSAPGDGSVSTSVVPSPRESREPSSAARAAATLADPTLGSTPGLPSKPSQSRPSGAEATGFVDLGGVHRVIRELRPAYEQLEAARGQVRAQLAEALASLPSSSRPTAMAFLRRDFPELPGVTPFASSSPGYPESPEHPPDPASPTPRGQEPGAGLVASLARSLLVDAQAPVSPSDQAAFLARIVEVLQTAAQAFVEIRAVQGRFGEEMGVRTIREYTPLHSAGDAREVLDYLLDWRRGGPERTAQLAAVYSDFMLHQVALINGVVDGVEAVLEQLEPGEIERGVSGLNRGAAAWKKYAERYAEIVEERGIAALVFGPEFARAYARVGG